MDIGGYETIRLLGKGGMSEVYEVENPRLGSRHALKLFTYEKDDPEVRERFEVEGRLLAKLSHPRIVRVTDMGVDSASGRPYFVMDLVLDASGEMKQLSDVPPGTADEDEIGRWYDDMREGLCYIHANGVIHRDLKLQNVLIGVDGHAVLTDFGISKIVDAKGEGSTIVDTVKTLVKVREGRSLVMGSLGYMAPELEMGVAASEKSDYYALGVIVYRLLTGTWCDSRTDVVGALETYDPVWRRIVPKLLHSNPAGRECLSYAEEKRADRERAECEAEEKWIREKGRGHRARCLARVFGVLAGILAGALAVGVHRHLSDRALWENRLKEDRAKLVERLRQTGGYAAMLPEFDDLFATPAEARTEEVEDANGNLVMPSRMQFEVAKVDALVLTQKILSDLRSGKIAAESAIQRLAALRDELNDGSDATAFDRLAIGGGEYAQLGDDEPLRMLLDRAIKKISEIYDL